MTPNSRKIIGIASAAIAVTAIAAGAAIFTYNRGDRPSGETNVAAPTTIASPTFEEYTDPTSESPTADRLIMYNGVQYRYRDDIDTLLLIGTDDFEMEEANATNRNTSQCDLLLLVVFDNTNKTYRIIQINRDTITGIRKYDIYGQYEGIIDMQIALSHTYGSGGDDSCRDTAYAVSRLLYESDVDYYLSITMSAVPILNDLVGGVDVLIEDNFEGVDDTFVMGETVHLEGEHALTFVRSRMSMPDDDTNIARMRRQQTYMTGFMEALSNAINNDPDFATRAFSAIGDYMVTDMTTDRLQEYADRFNEYEEEAIIIPEGESVMGDRYMEFYVDEDALQQLIVETFYEEV